MKPFEYCNFENHFTTFYGYEGEFPCGRVTLAKNYDCTGKDFLFYVHLYSDVNGRIIFVMFDKDFEEILVKKD